MPSHPDRVRRAPLLPSYQFGDAQPMEIVIDLRGSVLRDRSVLDHWRAPHENAAEQLLRLGVTANVIEGDHH